MDDVPEGLPEYFETLGRLGEGGMGVVWSVRDRRVDRVGALKVIREHANVPSVSLTRFEREIRNFAQLTHPYIVQVYDVGKMLTGEPYIFMEQVDGRPISRETLRGHSFSEVMELLDRILEGLGEAHAHNLIHRDLKPDNILVTVDAEGRLMPKLMDFGLALRADENDMRITSDGMVVGTPVYMAPEQACDEHYQICPATDFYGIGCILYELFCGEPPFKGANAVMVMVAQAKERPRPFKPLPQYPEATRLAPVIDRLLEKMPDRRYETAADFRAALRRLFLIRDGQVFGVGVLRDGRDTVFEARSGEDAPFLTSDKIQPYHAILSDAAKANYNYSVLSLRPPVFVGRSSAMHLLERYLCDVYQSRKASVVLVTGCPGVGKSRFLEAFTQECYRRGSANSLVVDGAVCASLRFAVFRALFSRLLLKTLTPQQVSLALCRFMQTDDEHDARVNALKSIYYAEVNQSAPPFDKMGTAFFEIFCKFTRNRPLVLCFDNVSQEQRAELCAIAQELTVQQRVVLPILICVVNTTINDMPTDLEMALGNESALWLRRSILLDPLSNSDMHILTTHSLGMSGHVAEYIDNLSSGLPQIAVNLARQWHLAGLLEPRPDGYESVHPLETLPIPRVVHEAVLRQIYMTFSDYPQRTWVPVASLAAVCGETFTPRLLSSAIQYIPTSQKLISHSTFISLALSGGVLRTVNETTLAFSNKLMQEALIAVLQDYELQDYHKAIAKARQAFPKSFNNDEEIARHMLAAHQNYDAYIICKDLARQCLMCGKYEQAARHVERAKDAIMQHLGFIDARTPEIVDIWFIEAETHLMLGQYELALQQLQWLEYAGQFHPEPERRAACLVLKARILGKDKISPEIAAYLDEALAIVQSLPSPLSREQREICFLVYAVRFRYDSTVAQKLIDIARDLNNLIYVGKAFLAFADQCLEQGDSQRAVRILNIAIDTAHKNDDIRTQADGLLLLSTLQKDAPEVQLKTLYDAQVCYEKLGDFQKLSQIHRDIALIIEQSDPEKAQQHLQWSQMLA